MRSAGLRKNRSRIEHTVRIFSKEAQVDSFFQCFLVSLFLSFLYQAAKGRFWSLRLGLGDR
jgi:hypothetical protein